MKRISIDEQIAQTARTWIPYPIAQVDDQVVYVAYYKDGNPQLYGAGNKFHQHDGDQLFVVLTGKVAFHDRVGGQIDAHKGDAVFVGRGSSTARRRRRGACVAC